MQQVWLEDVGWKSTKLHEGVDETEKPGSIFKKRWLCGWGNDDRHLLQMLNVIKIWRKQGFRDDAAEEEAEVGKGGSLPAAYT